MGPRRRYLQGSAIADPPAQRYRPAAMARRGAHGQDPISDRETLLQAGVTMSTVHAEASAPARAWTCAPTSGAQAGRELGVGARPVRIGADGACDLVLADGKVSRAHVELQATPDGLRVRDLGSTNGTFHGGARISEVVFTTDAAIEVGDTRIELRSRRPTSVTPSRRDRFGALIGESVVMRELFAILELASPTDSTVLLEGESGTGKELAARAIHDHSARAAAPFVIVDCSATSDNLVDSQLFGHLKGAFTGAVGDRKGAFVEADGGTLFLDELGELPLATQAKLLRALEAGTVQPLGSDRTVRVDVRVIAATHRPLASMVADGSFRFDLFYRLAVVHARLPPLRARPEDIAPLVAHFFEGRRDPGPIDGPNLDALRGHDWPGSVRELRNVIERAWVLGGGGVPFRELPVVLDGRGPAAAGGAEPVDTRLSFKEAKEVAIERFERRYLADVFARHDYNITHAAEFAGINRRHFRELLRKHGLVKGDDG